MKINPFFPVVLGVFVSAQAMAEPTLKRVDVYKSDYGQTSVTTVTEDKLANTSGLSNEAVGITPQVGAGSFRAVDGSKMTRGLVGLTVDVNGTGVLNQIVGEGFTNVYSGITFGALYSHIGNPSSNWVGSNEDSDVGSAGTNMVLLPINLKVGHSFGNFLLAAHAGGNLFYQSYSNSVALGTAPSSSSQSAWKMLPNAGLDLQYGAFKKVAVLLRPDWTFSGSNSVFSTTLGATIPL